jgi:hypothetical protein
MSRIAIVILIYHHQKPTNLIYIEYNSALILMLILIKNTIPPPRTRAHVLYLQLSKELHVARIHGVTLETMLTCNNRCLCLLQPLVVACLFYRTEFWQTAAPNDRAGGGKIYSLFRYMVLPTRSL